MTKFEAIRKKCVECCGGSRIDVTLCPVFDCPLWEFRCGILMRNNLYKERLELAKKNHPEMIKELIKDGIDMDKFDG